MCYEEEIKQVFTRWHSQSDPILTKFRKSSFQKGLPNERNHLATVQGTITKHFIT